MALAEQAGATYLELEEFYMKTNKIESVSKNYQT
jgi:hypothetical protein